jgi:hypothetical protein
MTLRRTPVGILLAVAAGLIASTAFGYGATKDPLRLALQRGDMPQSVKASLFGPAGPSRMKPDILRFIGTGLRGAEYSYTWPAGGQVNVPGLGPTEKDWHLSGRVYVAPTPAAARTLFQDGKRAEHGFFSDFGTDGAVRLALPRYGDEQFGLLGVQGAKESGGPQAMVFVRRGVVVWELRIGHSPPKWTVTRAQVLAQLKAYALKQKARVG